MNTTTTQFIETEFQKRLDLINDENFRKICIKAAKKLGITAKEWNENKAAILMLMANQFCK